MFLSYKFLKAIKSHQELDNCSTVHPVEWTAALDETGFDSKEQGLVLFPEGHTPALQPPSTYNCFRKLSVKLI